MDTSKSNYSSFNLKRFSRLAVVILLVVLASVAVVPGYWSGNWSWSSPPKVAHLNQIKNLRQTGLTLPGWETLDQAEVKIGSHDWSAQIIQQQQTLASLFLLPQNSSEDQPEVEWMDIQGAERWKSDSYKQLRLSLNDQKSVTVQARFFRAWNRRETYAVVQWYAWSSGGHFAPVRWFWADQLAQLHRRRVPWVAVCLKIPIEPLGDLDAVEPTAESLAKTVQIALTNFLPR